MFCFKPDQQRLLAQKEEHNYQHDDLDRLIASEIYYGDRFQ